MVGGAPSKALQSVQPFAPSYEARALGVEWPATAEEELLADHCYALNALWNIDKHRRLRELAWAPAAFRRRDLAPSPARPDTWSARAAGKPGLASPFVRPGVPGAACGHLVARGGGRH